VTGPETVTRGPLRPGELAQAAVMAALSAATAIIAVIVPLAAGLSLLGGVPMDYWPTGTASVCSSHPLSPQVSSRSWWAARVA